MTPKQLAEIEERAKNATPGPWAVGVWADHMPESGLPCDIFVDDEHQDTVASFIDTYHRHLAIDQSGAVHADAEFIANARTDIPALIAEVHRLREALVAIKAMPDTNQQGLYMTGYNTALNTAWHIADRALREATDDPK